MSTLYIKDANGNYIPVPTIRGAKGDPGVYVGTEEPNDPNVKVWVEPDATPEPVVKYERQTLSEAEKAQARENIGVPEQYVLPVVTEDTLGGMMVGEGLVADEDGRVGVDNGLELLLTHEVTAENRADVYRFEFDDVSEFECYMFFPKIEGGTAERVSGYIGHIGYYIEDALNPYADKYCLLQYKKALGRLGFDGIHASREGYSVLAKTVGMFIEPQKSSNMNCAITMHQTTQGYPIGTKFEIYGKRMKNSV